jgi:N-acetylglucosaminyldiphosphoundecaprenol N-acetyl-beta-D-mannosaminyltransferase
MDDAVGAIGGWIRQREPTYVCLVPAHSVMEARRDEEYRDILNGSGLTTPDGMSIVWLLKLRGQQRVQRVYGPDLMLEVCRVSVDAGWSHFLYGGEEGVAEDLVSTLESRYPGLRIAGTHSPPFRQLTPEEDAEVSRRIEDSGADVVWVGIGSPRQERWIAEHAGKVGAPVLIGVGAAFDFLSGRKPQAPRWIQRAGLEWLFRLATEPRRLWRRYAEYPLFVLLATTDLLRSRRSETNQ